MLSYQYNEIEAVEHVESLQDLAFLDFYANSLRSLQGLSPLTGLRVLMLGRNRLSDLSGALQTTSATPSAVLLRHVYQAYITNKGTPQTQPTCPRGTMSGPATVRWCFWGCRSGWGGPVLPLHPRSSEC